MLVLIGIVSGVVAFAVGKWRHSCVFWLRENPANLPPAWVKPDIRFGSLILVVVFTLIFATCVSYVVSQEVNQILGELLWGALVFFRWAASAIAAQIECAEAKKKIDSQVEKYLAGENVILPPRVDEAAYIAKREIEQAIENHPLIQGIPDVMMQNMAVGVRALILVNVIYSLYPAAIESLQGCDPVISRDRHKVSAVAEKPPVEISGGFFLTQAGNEAIYRHLLKNIFANGPEINEAVKEAYYKILATGFSFDTSKFV
jgi:hypothetical protein